MNDLEKVRDEDENINQDDKFFTWEVNVFIFLFVVILCCIGGLLYQFEVEIKTFFSAVGQTTVDVYVNAPPFVKGFLLTVAIIIGLILLVGLFLLFILGI